MRKNQENINISVEIRLPKGKAFNSFFELNKWWPKEYTWSGETLEKIDIEPEVNGKCYEIGPKNFWLDWGRVLEYDYPNRIIFTWQISPARVPEPNDKRASEVKIGFISIDNFSTRIEFAHKNFSNHGDGWQTYLELLKSEEGWPYILNKYKTFCEKKI